MISDSCQHFQCGANLSQPLYQANTLTKCIKMNLCELDLEEGVLPAGIFILTSKQADLDGNL